MKCTIRLTKDWYCGSGNERRGDLDRLIARDAEGLPYLPGKTIKGVWRDACEQVAYALDGDGAGGWNDLVKVLFGGQPATVQGESSVALPGCLIIDSARFRPGLRLALMDSNVKRAVTFAKPAVSICQATGVAKDETNRIVEMARGGCELEFEVHWSKAFGDPLQPALEALLLAGAKLVDDIGGKRNRGSGQCQLLPDATLDLAVLEQPAPQIAERTPDKFAHTVATSGGGSSTWKRAVVYVHLESSVLVPSKVLGNVVECRDNIPGGMLLVALGKKNPRVWELAHAGRMRVTDATLLLDGAVGRPMPFCLIEPKGEPKEPKRNRLLPVSEDDRIGTKECRGGYLGLDQDVVASGKVAKVHKTHNVVDDTQGRPTEDVGGVYTYEAIAPFFMKKGELRQQIFAFEVYAEAQEIGALLLALPDVVRLGSSKNVEYGKCRLVAQSPEAVPQPPDGERSLTIWLLSDMLLYDEHMRPSPTPDALCQALSVELRSTVALPKTDAKVYIRQTRRDGWHAGWGLAQPTLPCLAAGSVVQVVLAEPPTDLSDRLLRIASSGLGERRAEGFGHIAINDSMLAKETVKVAEGSGSATPNTMALDNGDLAYLEQIKQEAIRDDIRVRAQAKAATATQYHKLPNSQYGNLRALIAGLETPGQQYVTDWFDKLNQVSNRREKWGKAFNSFRTLLAERGQVWTDLGLDDPGSDTRWADAVRLWVEAIARHESKKTSDGTPQGGDNQ